MEKRLEKHPLFAHVAWTTVVLFALFTVHLSLRLMSAADLYAAYGIA